MKDFETQNKLKTVSDRNCFHISFSGGFESLSVLRFDFGVLKNRQIVKKSKRQIKGQLMLQKVGPVKSSKMAEDDEHFRNISSCFQRDFSLTL